LNWQPLWFRARFPWLGAGFVHAVAEDYLGHMFTGLRMRDFVIVEIDGREERNLHDQLTAAFGRPDYRGTPVPRPPDEAPNWDSLIDYFRDLEFRHAPPLSGMEPIISRRVTRRSSPKPARCSSTSSTPPRPS